MNSRPIRLPLLVFLLGSLCSTGLCDEEKRTLVLSTWGFRAEEVRETLIQPFEELHNVRVVFDEGNNKERLQRLLDTGGEGVDVIALSLEFSQIAADQDLLEPIRAGELENEGQLLPAMRRPNGPRFGPACTLMQAGFLVDPKRLASRPSSFLDLFDEQIRGRVALPAMNHSLGQSMIAKLAEIQGGSVEDPESAFQALASMSSFYATTSELIEVFRSGQVDAGLVPEYCREAVEQARPGLVWVNPSEGGIPLVNTLNVVRGSENRELALLLIDHLISATHQRAAWKANLSPPVNALALDRGRLELVRDLACPDAAALAEVREAWFERWQREVAQSR